MSCYQEAIGHTSTPEAPWYIIPADSKPIARFMVARILLEVLGEYKDMQYPELPEEIQDNIKKYKEELENED